MIRAILLDLFGTVVAYGDIAAGTRLAWEGIHRVLCRLGANPPFEEFAREWQAQFLTPLRADEHWGETPFISKLVRLFRSYGAPPDLAAAREAVRACLAGWDAHTLLPEDTLPALKALHQQGYAVALVTNFDHPPYVYDLLRERGLEGQFDAVIISGEVGVDKPDPKIFQTALQAVQCAPEEALFVGDSLEADIAGAEAVGCRAILIDRQGMHAHFPGPRIARLDELLAYPSINQGRPM
ncbi:MAG: HAD family hydrolase [Chloroflexi bacterium]|nr:HAD family hydrolase [Chloroflexota bacterium]